MSDDETFEACTDRLAQIVADLERGDLPLERSLALFEEGVALARRARSQIERAERRVEELLSFDPQGKPVTREMRAGGAEGPPGRTAGASEEVKAKAESETQ